MTYMLLVPSIMHRLMVPVPHSRDEAGERAKGVAKQDYKNNDEAENKKQSATAGRL